VALNLVGDQHGQLRFIGSVGFGQAAHRQNLGVPYGHQGDLAIVVVEADPYEPLVRNTFSEVHQMEVTQVYAALGELAVEPHHQRLVLGTNRTNQHVLAVLEFPRPGVLRRVRPDRRFRRIHGLARVQNYTGIQRQQLLRPGEQGINVDFLDPFLFHHQVAEAHQQPFERGQVHRLAPAHTAQRAKNHGALHKPARQRGVERRQTDGAVLIHLHQLPPAAEQQHRAELRIDARSED